jgi:PAS domain S-box-containing protein
MSGGIMSREEQIAQLVVDRALDAVVITNGGGAIVAWNHQAEVIFGWPAEEAIGRTITDTIIPPERQEAYRMTQAAVEAAGRGFRGERRSGLGLRRNGDIFPVEVSISVLPVGESRLVSHFIRDQTERERAYELLRAGDEQRRRLLAKLVRAQEEERQRIAGDIHDDTVQVLTALALRLDMLRRRLDDPAALAEIAEAERTARLAITRLRHLMFELRPPALDRDGLVSALLMHLEQVKHDYGIDFALENRLVCEPQEETRALVYRIAQEAVVNAAKHAQASRVDVRLAEEDGVVLVTVADDGRGFEPAGERHGHLGLIFMRERAEMAGGWCRIDSAPGRGASVEFAVPSNGAAVSRD